MVNKEKVICASPHHKYIHAGSTENQWHRNCHPTCPFFPKWKQLSCWHSRDNKKTFKPKVSNQPYDNKKTRWTILKKRLSGHVRPGPMGSPPNEPLNIPWPRKYHSALSKRLGLFAAKTRLLSLVFSLTLKAFTSTQKHETREGSRKVWTQHLAFKSN